MAWSHGGAQVSLDANASFSFQNLATGGFEESLRRTTRTAWLMAEPCGQGVMV